MLTIAQYDALTDVESLIKQLHAILGLFTDVYATKDDAHLIASSIEAGFEQYMLAMCTITEMSLNACEQMAAALASLEPTPTERLYHQLPANLQQDARDFIQALATQAGGKLADQLRADAGK